MNLKYPLYGLYIGEGSGEFVVKFTALSKGTVVWSNNPVRHIGTYLDYWTECTHRDWKIITSFDKFKETKDLEIAGLLTQI